MKLFDLIECEAQRRDAFARAWFTLLKDERAWGSGTRFDEAISRAAFHRLVRPIPPDVRNVW